MNWSKVKTILIVLFLGVNIFLLTSMMISANKTIMISSETLDNTIEILNKNNIEIDRELIPKKVENLSFLVVRNTFQDTNSIVQQLLGKGYSIQINDDVITFTKGPQIIKITGFKFEYIDTTSDAKISKFDDTTLEEHARKFLEKLRFNLQYIYLSKIEQKDENTYRLTFMQKYADAKVYGNDIIVEITSGNHVRVKGYGIEPVELIEKIPSRQVTGALIEFIREEERAKEQKTTITDISIGYYIQNINDEWEFRDLIIEPSWRIVSDDGKSYYYPAIP